MGYVSEKDNKNKSQAGHNVKEALDSFCQTFEQKLSPHLEYVRNFKVNADDKKIKQFTMDAELIYWDQNKIKKNLIFVRTSSSYRSDRIKGNEFEAENIRLILKDNPDIGDIHIFFAIPDTISLKEKKNFLKFRNQILNKEIVSYFDDVLTMDQLSIQIIRRALVGVPQGVKSNILGNLGEYLILQSLLNPKNVDIWNGLNSSVIKSQNFHTFQTIISSFGYAKSNKITKVKCVGSGSITSTSPYFKKQLSIVINGGKNKGKPKTDVAACVEFNNGENIKFNISVKYPNGRNKRITVHQGKVSQLLNDLLNSMPEHNCFSDNGNFNELKEALTDFEISGSKKEMKQSNVSFLQNNLYHLNRWLIGYFIFGINNSYFSEIQAANLLVSFDPMNGKIHASTVDEVTDKMIKLIDENSYFGTPFSWTYPSKKRGKEIQIKAPLIV